MTFLCPNLRRFAAIHEQALENAKRKFGANGEYIEVGTGGGAGDTCPQDLAINYEVPF